MEFVNYSKVDLLCRYSYTGAASTSAKGAISLEWCKLSDRGIMRPDLVIYLGVSLDEAIRRGVKPRGNYQVKLAAFSACYRTANLTHWYNPQAQLRLNYAKLVEDNWRIIDTEYKTARMVFEEVVGCVEEEIATRATLNPFPVRGLWDTSEFGFDPSGMLKNCYQNNVCLYVSLFVFLHLGPKHVLFPSLSFHTRIGVCMYNVFIPPSRGNGRKSHSSWNVTTVNDKFVQ